MDVTWLKTRTTNIEGWSHVYLKVRFEEMTKQQKIFHKFSFFCLNLSATLPHLRLKFQEHGWHLC